MESEADLTDTASVRYHAEACSRLFLSLLEIEETEGNSSNEIGAFWATRQSADFNLWCVKLGVESDGYRSIDVRLKDVPEICDLLRGLLQSLYRDLDQLRQQYTSLNIQSAVAEEIYDDISESSSISFDSLPSFKGSPSHDTSKDVNTEQKLELELKRHVADTIDRLQAHAMRIERAGAEHRRRRVETYREKELPKQIYEGFKSLGRWKANEQFKLASEVIKERTAESFARRRIRFEYLSKHQKKRAIDVRDAPERAPEPLSTDEKAKEEVMAVPNTDITKLPITPNVYYPHDQKTIFSATVNTQYNFTPKPQTKERAESVRSIALLHTGFPPPPQIHRGRFQCPYCLLDFQEAEAGRDRWKQHVMQDFEPYFCTFDTCNTPFEVPNSFDGLLDHMQSHLPVRYHLDEPDGQHREYVEADFERHISTHRESLNHDMVTLKAVSRRKGAFLFESCPFCGGYPDDLEKRFPDRDIIDAQRELRKHIKQHMQEIALFLPPYRSDIFGNDDDDQKASGVTHRRSDQDEIPENLDDFKKFCNQADCDCRDSRKDSGEADEIIAQTGIPGENSHKIESRWICCQCGRDYRDTISSNCRPCEYHEKCQSCLRYEHDSSHDGDWPFLIQDSILYNRVEVTNMELLEDNRLLPFIMRYAVGGPEGDEQELGVWRDSEQRAELYHLAFEYVHEQPEKIGEGGPLDFRDGVVVILRLLDLLSAWPTLPPTSPDQKVLLVAAQNGDLSHVRKFFLLDYHRDEVIMNDVQPVFSHPLTAEVSEDERTPAFLKNIPIWIEWKFDDPSLGFSEPWVLDHVRKLVRMLKEINSKDQAMAPEGHRFRVPQCLGYFHDKEYGRFGIIFKKPGSSNYAEKPLSLRDIITYKPRLRTLEWQIELTNVLIETFQRFHTSGYLHKGICSGNILFAHQLLDVAIREPYISGFGIPPCVPSYASTERAHDIPLIAIYCHPFVQSNRGTTFQLVHDRYSLGIVLLEIAHWKLIDEIMEINIQQARLSQIWEVRGRLLSKNEARILDAVAFKLGKRVATFIRACIEGVQAEWETGSNEILAPPSFSTRLASSSIKSPQEQLAEFFKPSQPHRIFGQSEVDKIAELLRQFDEPAYQNPRTYIILRTIDKIGKLGPLLDTGFSDYDFPVTRGLLSPEVLNAETRTSIVRQQHLVMSAAQDLEMGSHCHFSAENPTPIEYLEILGYGRSAVVEKVRSTVSFEVYVLKRIRRGGGGRHREQLAATFISEIKSMKRLRHIHVVKFIGSYTDIKNLGFLTLPVADSNLGEFMALKDPESSTSSSLRQHFGCLATAVAYIHSQGISHNELKPHNVLLHQNSVMIADFRISLNSDVSDGEDENALKYAAPETIAQDTPESPIDIWALGCIFLEMTAFLHGYVTSWIEGYYSSTGSHSSMYYQNHDATIQLLDEFGNSEDADPQVPLAWIRRMLQLDRSKRPTAAEIMDMIRKDEYTYTSPTFCGSCCAYRDVKDAGSSHDFVARRLSEGFDQGRGNLFEAGLDNDSDTETDEEGNPTTIECSKCDTMFTGKYRRGNYARHMRQKHMVPGIYLCEYHGCTKTFGRKHSRLKHYRKHHPDFCKERFGPEPKSRLAPELSAPDLDALTIPHSTLENNSPPSKLSFNDLENDGFATIHAGLTPSIAVAPRLPTPTWEKFEESTIKRPGEVIPQSEPPTWAPFLESGFNDLDIEDAASKPSDPNFAAGEAQV